jgi:uncharacterized phage protein (TIGR02216 family)
MAAAFGLLRLSPRDFWSMTPREMERAMSVLPGTTAGAPGRGDLAEMMRRFPDPAPSSSRPPPPLTPPRREEGDFLEERHG